MSRSDRPARPIALLVALAAALFATGCTSAYYSAMEKVGIDKRDILRSRIEDGRDDQEAAQEQIKTTYERLKEVAGSEGGDLEAAYGKLSSAFERSEARAQAVTDRIESIEEVASDLWTEWEAEIELIGSQKARGQSRRILTDTQGRYARVIGAMKRAEAKMPPVIGAFRDQVLLLKHSLNAQAIASLEGTVVEIESEVESLIREIDASIREAEKYLAAPDRA